MRIEDVVFFSPKYRAIDINFENTDLILDAFNDRVISYYLSPVKLMNRSQNPNNAFAAGVLLLSSIDAITKFTMKGGVSHRIKEFAAFLLKDTSHSDVYKQLFIDKFNEDFRNGLIHEGRIKNCSQFSYDYPFLEIIDKNVLIINPSLLESKLQLYFADRISAIKNEKMAAYIFFKNFKAIFESEVNYFLAQG